MKAHVSKSDLRKATLIAKKKRALKSSPVAPRLTIKAVQGPHSGEDFAVLISGTKNHCIETKVNCGINEGGRLSCDLVEFDEKVREVESDTVIIEEAGEAVVVRGENEEPSGDHIVGEVDGDEHYTSEGLFEDSFIDHPKKIEQLQWNLEAAFRIVNSTNRTENKHPNLHQIHHEGFGKDAGIGATDGAGAIKSSLTLPISHPISIPPETAKAISYAIKKEDPDKIEFLKNENDQYCWTIGDTDIYFAEVDENFPSIEQVTPDDFDFTREIKAKDLLSMVKSLRKEDQISLQFTDDGLRFTETGEQGECLFERQFMAKHTYRKLKGVLKHLDGDETVTVKATDDAHSPVIFHYYEDGWGLDVDTIIMPVKKSTYESPVETSKAKRGISDVTY